MPCPSCSPAPVCPGAAELNQRIRQLCEGRTVWTPEALAELGRLRAEWRVAVERETARA